MSDCSKTMLALFGPAAPVLPVPGSVIMAIGVPFNPAAFFSEPITMPILGLALVAFGMLRWGRKSS